MKNLFHKTFIQSPSPEEGGGNWGEGGAVKRVLSLLAMVFGVGLLPLAAQNIDAEFEVIDLGDIIFERPTTATFNLKNRGSEFFLDNVKPFCGCTKVSFPKKNIKKGENFKVSVTYDAKLLGHFQKDVALVSQQFDQPFYLTVKGNVVAEQAATALPDNSFVMGKLRVAYNRVDFPDTHQGDVLQAKIPFTNIHKEAVTPLVIHVPSYMTARVTPSVIQPNKQGIITLELNASLMPSYGLTQATLYVASEPGDVAEKGKDITVSAVKLPTLMFSESMMQRAPKINLSTTELALQGSSLKGEVTITNSGRSPLHITTLQTTAPGLNITLSSTTIEAGESALLKVKGVKKQLKNIEAPKIIIIADDPSQQKSIINISK